mmetsp:Transcript_16265/g.27762  ORF Transcript_16265/g.27762 Transcript_16265/m.27762 type:complete len:202 (-) Transcript_16265:470-1075(-)
MRRCVSRRSRSSGGRSSRGTEEGFFRRRFFLGWEVVLVDDCSCVDWDDFFVGSVFFLLELASPPPSSAVAAAAASFSFLSATFFARSSAAAITFSSTSPPDRSCRRNFLRSLELSPSSFAKISSTLASSLLLVDAVPPAASSFCSLLLNASEDSFSSVTRLPLLSLFTVSSFADASAVFAPPSETSGAASSAAAALPSLSL